MSLMWRKWRLWKRKRKTQRIVQRKNDGWKKWAIAEVRARRSSMGKGSSQLSRDKNPRKHASARWNRMIVNKRLAK